MKESINAKGEHITAEDATGGGDGAADMRGALVVSSKNNSDKSNHTENGNSNGTRTRDRPPSISVSTRGNGGGAGDARSKNASKNPTPLTASFATTTDTTRSRPSRAKLDLPAKRSHKKGAGIAAQIAAAAAAAAAAAQDDETSSIQGEEEVEEIEGEGGEEPRYCYCNEVSYGNMVGCDAEDCPREWFHLDCVGLNKPPSKNGESPFLLSYAVVSLDFSEGCLGGFLVFLWGACKTDSFLGCSEMVL